MMTYGDLKALAALAANEMLGRDFDFQCETMPGSGAGSVDLITTPLTQHERDLLWGALRDKIPVGVTVNIKPVLPGKG